MVLIDNPAYNFDFKLVIVGDSAVGKTHLLRRFVHDKFDHSSMSTIGVDLLVKEMVVNHTWGRIQLWDTAGQERFRSATKRYYRGCVGALVVYDITKHASFENIPKWLEELQFNDTHPDLRVIMIGNKSDLDDQREVTIKEGLEFAKKHKLMFMETSALDCSNVDNAFYTLISNVHETSASQIFALSDKDVLLPQGEVIKLNSSRTRKRSFTEKRCSC
ncbi:Rab11A, rab family GTPase [Phycomyces blakesleeanus]|uniref:Uncharacterized protein n=2 Tax=Phycomyces blakesleeanus TaxID=4837 RepID=A0A162V610_PHYB8|nr:hypothetical protein PHYBLDRAFT_154221 [Phycomyces blakesleeanus NRRL 1555(-)]OAD80253.1 hypothetical protein PHYBLDRAFT_154221 [Phycomyces blakesleeanus NRRL 1555(-)]|eukprot:XP_018298293.1 hypothetical protein PHYBLDRAFT_154221 [Phycomyces blakesleeanus NRRL 1555(-)]